jgi:adenine-specific DNA-methyltransferase
MAFVLPSSALHADYARQVVTHLTARFGGVRLIRVSDVVFADAQEDAVVLAADRRGGSCQSAELEPTATLRELAVRLSSPSTPAVLSRNDPSPDMWKLHNVSAHDRDLVTAVLRDVAVKKLGDVATIRIGIVTGANAFFLRRRDDDLLSASGMKSVLAVSRSAWLHTPSISAEDLDAQDDSARTRLLVIEKSARRSPRVRAALKEQETHLVHKRSHCARRDPWFLLKDLRPPDSFLPYMGVGPRPVVVNLAGAVCTNAIHRLWWKPTVANHDVIALSTWTTLYTVGAELLGRSYGGGVFKVEPGAATQLPVVDGPLFGLTVPELTELARSHSPEAVRREADAVILSDTLGLTRSQQSRLRAVAARLANQRRHA